MKRTFEVCDHCGDAKPTVPIRYEVPNLVAPFECDLCEDCMDPLMEHLEQFVKVNQVHGTTSFKDSGMKGLR